MLLSARSIGGSLSMLFAVALAGCGGRREGRPSTAETRAAGAGAGGAGSSSQAGGAAGTGGDTGGTGGAPVPTELVHRVGRFDESDPTRPVASWSGTTFRTRVSGTSLSVSLGGASGVIFQV